MVKKRLEHKHPLAIRWFHWINFPVLFLMIWSGLLIYWANDVYRIGVGETTLFKFFPQAFYERFNIGFRLAEGMAIAFHIYVDFCHQRLALRFVFGVFRRVEISAAKT